MPPVTAGIPGNTGMDANAQGGAPAAQQPGAGGQPGQGQPDLSAMIGQIRQAAAPLEQILASLPFLKPQQDSLRKLLKEVVTGIAAKAPKQTPSADALP